jgi:hypothetical protein
VAAQTLHKLWKFFSLLNKMRNWKTQSRWQKHKKEYRDADKSLARTGRKKATATEDFEFHISHL